MSKEKKKDMMATVRAMKDEEIGIELTRLRSELVSLRGQSVSEQVEDHSRFRSNRVQIARLLTERRARSLAKGG